MNFSVDIQDQDASDLLKTSSRQKPSLSRDSMKTVDEEEDDQKQ